MNSDQDRQELDNSVQQISTSLLKMIGKSDDLSFTLRLAGRQFTFTLIID